MSEKSATPILVAGAVCTVVLLGVAWMFAASTSRQAVVNAEAYAAEKAASSQAEAAEADAKKVAETEAAEAEAKKVAEAEAAEAEAKKVAEAEAAEAEAKKVAEAAEAKAEDLAKSVVPGAADAEEPAVDDAVVTAAVATTAAVAIEGDAKAGAKVFRKCKACHKIGDNAKNAVGPYLTGIVGRVQGSAEGFGNYSDGFKAAMAAGAVWTPEELDAFLTKPKEYMPGTGMAFGGLRKEKDRINVIAYLAGSE